MTFCESYVTLSVRDETMDDGQDSIGINDPATEAPDAITNATSDGNDEIDVVIADSVTAGTFCFVMEKCCVEEFLYDDLTHINSLLFFHLSLIDRILRGRSSGQGDQHYLDVRRRL